jgi:hypothetical protein
MIRSTVENAMNEDYAKDSEQASPGFNVTVSLSAGAIEVLAQLFICGPTYDGNVVSKQARDELYDLKLIGRCTGYQFLTATGIRLALSNGLDRKKESRCRDERQRLTKLSQIEELLMMPQNGCAVGSTVMGMEPKRPQKEL